MPAVVVDALTKHRQAPVEDRRAAAEDWVETDLVFTTATRRHVEPRNLNTAYGRLLAKAGFRLIRFHDPRHTCAALLPATTSPPEL
jgi:hypothetical protein